jgi:hypothetical protein
VDACNPLLQAHPT